MKPCIIILAYPDTDNKIQILNNTINSVTGLQHNGEKIPVFVFSNLDIDLDRITEIDKFIYSGKNEMLAASDFFTPEMVAKARELTKYRHNITSENLNVSYVPLRYGTEKNYYWALTELYQLAINWVNESGFTHFMLLQELNLGEGEIQLVYKYFSELNDSDLDGIVAFEPDQGHHHMSDFVFFGKSKWWSELFGDMTAEDFYFTTYPNFTVEEYYHRKLILKEGNIKYKVRKRLNDNQLDYWEDSPLSWQKEILDIDCNTTCTWKLFFPNLVQDNFISNEETVGVDIVKSVDIAILSNGETGDIFVFNKSMIEVWINIICSDTRVNNFNFHFGPRCYRIIPTGIDLKGTELTIAYTYYDGSEKCQTKFYQL